MQKQFFLDITRLKEVLLTQKSTINSLVRGLSEAGKERDILLQLLDRLNLENTEETLYIAYSRIAHLREDGLVSFLENRGTPDEQKNAILEKAYDFVADFYREKQEVLLDYIRENGLLSPFYQTLIEGVHDIGLHFTKFYKKWRRHINYINTELLERHSTPEGVKGYLKMAHLLDTRNLGELGDRSYSVLIREGDTYIRKTYADAFSEEITSIQIAVKELQKKLSLLEDDLFSHKDIFLTYFEILDIALGEHNPDHAIEAWARVDVAWMDIKTPLQIAHPFEWYEDRYRDAVSPEWDLRLSDTTLFVSTVKDDVKNMFLTLSSILKLDTKDEVYSYSLGSLDRVQLYICHPCLYYGAFFTGLFSAQVLPNDNIVSRAHGKKIFSFAANTLVIEQTKPQMQLTHDMVGKDLIAKEKLIVDNEQLFYHVYDITTIGHEYGHTLWLEHDTEMRMNDGGNFKNIEEWKATMGGLMAFFLRGDQSNREEVLVEHIMRSIKVMAWREVTERIPYYCECLIHLDLLFRSGVVAMNTEGKITMHLDDANYEKLKELALEAYKKLALTYIGKEDASNFLYTFVVREDGVFLPKDSKVRAFVESYYKRYREIGNQIRENI